MTYTKAEVLFALEMPPAVKKMVWDKFAELEAAGKPISDRTKAWKLTWEKLWAGESVEVVDQAPSIVWTELFESIEEFGAFVTKKEG